MDSFLDDMAFSTSPSGCETVSTSTAAASNSRPDQVRLLPKWQIVGGSAPGTKSSSHRPLATLKPGSKPQKATLLTKNGPQDVRFL